MCLYWSETVFYFIRAVLRRVQGPGLTPSDAVETHKKQGPSLTGDAIFWK